MLFPTIIDSFINRHLKTTAARDATADVDSSSKHEQQTTCNNGTCKIDTVLLVVE